MTVTTPEMPPGIEIRKAVRADLLGVYRIERDSFPQPWPFEAFERYLGASGFLVAEDSGAAAAADAATEPNLDGGIVGYVVTEVSPHHGRTYGHVKDIAVAPDRRGEGIGRVLLRSALAVCEDENARQVKLEVRVENDAARALYYDHGFREHRRISGYYDDGEDAIVMVREE